jgi:DNA modification methylase
VLCGDATNPDHVSKLMRHERADMVFADFPYNVDYQGYTEDRLKLQGDCMSPAEFDNFLNLAFANYRAIVDGKASLYICHPSIYQRQFQCAMEKSGFQVRCQIIWAKQTFAWGFGRYKFQHEPIFYAHTAGQSDHWYGDKRQSTVWQEDKPVANREHPTMKPVALVERALINSSRSGDLVVDLFGGSGTTLIGCERLKRKARLMEIDPVYVDVIITRWQNITGREATLEQDGRTFAMVADERKIARNAASGRVEEAVQEVVR